MLNLNSFILFSEKPSVLVEFYKNVFQAEPDWSGGEFRSSFGKLSTSDSGRTKHSLVCQND